jgi:hypothetical protein
VGLKSNIEMRVVQGQHLKFKGTKESTCGQEDGGCKAEVSGKTSWAREERGLRDRNRVQGSGRGFWERK